MVTGEDEGEGGGDGNCGPLPIRFVYSLMTLQHNPPELISCLIGRLCAALAVGGGASFAICTGAGSRRGAKGRGAGERARAK